MVTAARQLIEQLFADPELAELQRNQLNACSQELAQQGFAPRGQLESETIDTQVGLMRRMGTTFQDPLSESTLDLVVNFLCKVDGNVQCWSELWGTQAQALEGQVSRRIQLGSGLAVDIPKRLRLTRLDHFEGKLTRGSASRTDRQALLRMLRAQGLFAHASVGSCPGFAARVAQAFTA